MKKLFLIGIALLTAQLSFAQTSIWDRFSFGLKAGANYTDFDNANFETEGLAGFHAGAIINFRITDNWSIQEDFLYSTQGAKLKNNMFGSDAKIKLSYLAVPIVVKYHSNIGLYGEIGGQANMLIKDAENTGFGDFADKVDAGMVGGIGYQFRQGPAKGLGIGARYYYGLMDVGKFNSTTIKSDFKNTNIQLSLSYIF